MAGMDVLHSGERSLCLKADPAAEMEERVVMSILNVPIASTHSCTFSINAFSRQSAVVTEKEISATGRTVVISPFWFLPEPRFLGCPSMS